MGVAVSLGEAVTAEVTAQAMSMVEIDELGLDEADRCYMAALAQTYDGHPVGPKNLTVLIWR